MPGFLTRRFLFSRNLECIVTLPQVQLFRKCKELSAFAIPPTRDI